MKCFLTLLGISFRDHITNEEVKARIAWSANDEVRCDCTFADDGNAS